MRLIMALLLIIAGTASGSDLNAYKAAEQKAYGLYFEHISTRGRLDSRLAQEVAWMRTYVGRPDLAINTDLHFVSARVKTCKVALGGQQALDPLAYVTEAAKDFDILLLNESHHEGRTRYFLLNTLDRFWKAGYRHIGFEGLNISVASWADYDQLKKLPGFYLWDPLFSAIIRRALERGFKLFPYEYQGKYPDVDDWKVGMDLREAGQAKNIAAYYNEIPKGDRILIWAGFQHISQARRNPEESPNWMAARLEADHNIRPYSVDLTGCSFEASAGAAPRLYLDEKGVPILSEKAARWVVNAQIHLPTQAAITPGYFRAALGHKVDAPNTWLPPERPLLLQAFKPEQPEGAAPYDSVLMFGGESLPLYLAPGDYILAAYDKNGKRLKHSRISVSDD